MQDTLLVQTYQELEQDIVRFLTQRLKCRSTAKDLAQETFLRLSQVEDPASIKNTRAYLYRVASNLATDFIRVESRRAALLRETVSDWKTHGIGPEREVAAKLELDYLLEVVTALPPLSRRIFYLNRFENLPQRQIARRLRVSTTTVEKHIKKVLELLAQARDRFETPNF